MSNEDYRYFEAQAHAMEPATLAAHLEYLANDIRSVSKVKREALLVEAGVRMFAAGLLLNPRKGLSISEDKLRQRVLGGVEGDFSGTLIGELEDQMRTGGGED